MKKIILILLVLLLSGSCQNSQPVKIDKLEFRIAETEPADSLEEFTMSRTDKVFYLHKKSELSEVHVVSTKMVEWQNSEAIELTFNDEGTQLFAELTRNNVGNRIGMVLNGELVTAPIVQAEIPNGRAFVPRVKSE